MDPIDITPDVSRDLAEQIARYCPNLRKERLSKDLIQWVETQHRAELDLTEVGRPIDEYVIRRKEIHRNRNSEKAKQARDEILQAYLGYVNHIEYMYRRSKEAANVSEIPALKKGETHQLDVQPIIALCGDVIDGISQLSDSKTERLEGLIPRLNTNLLTGIEWEVFRQKNVLKQNRFKTLISLNLEPLQS